MCIYFIVISYNRGTLTFSSHSVFVSLQYFDDSKIIKEKK